MNCILQSAQEVFSFLIEQGGLDVERYDFGILEELCSKLQITRDVCSVLRIPAQNLRSAIDEYRISTKDVNNAFLEVLGVRRISIEQLINAFFKAVEPYAQMMNDLCEFFYQHGPKRTNEGIRMLFDFGKGSVDLNFDLRHFREQMQVWWRITRNIEVYTLDQITLWRLADIFGRRWGTTPRESSEWLEAYDNGQWPFPLPPAPRVGVQEVDIWLERAWRVWESVVLACSTVSSSRSDLLQRAFGSKKSAQEGPNFKHRYELEIPDFDEQDLKELAILDSDHWPGTMARSLYGWAEEIRKYPLQERLNLAHPILQELERLFSQVPHQTKTVQDLVQALIDLLNLPAWKRRHELYQVWVLTQIDKALRGYKLRVHHVDGTLLFKFSGTHIATATCADGNLHIWSELRTPLETPTGRGRKRGIQPDYTITLEPITHPDSTRFVVETKQYQRASARNFVAALTDYARGRPKAKVILVNYGSASRLVLEGIPNDLRSRTYLLGNFRPGEQAVLEEFKRLICESLPAPVAFNSMPVRSVSLRTNFQTCSKGIFNLIAIDVSGSMKEHLSRCKTTVLEILKMAVLISPEATLLAIDTEVRLKANADDEGLQKVLSLPCDGGTNLPEALAGYDLSNSLVITDVDGWNQLDQRNMRPKMLILLN